MRGPQKIIRMLTQNTQDPHLGRSLRNLVHALHDQFELVHLSVVQHIGQQDVGVSSLVALAREQQTGAITPRLP